jgi:hypothetical protein
MTPVDFTLLNSILQCVRGLVMALSGCVGYAVVDVQCDVLLCGFRE